MDLRAVLLCLFCAFVVVHSAPCSGPTLGGSCEVNADLTVDAVRLASGDFITFTGNFTLTVNQEFGTDSAAGINCPANGCSIKIGTITNPAAVVFSQGAITNITDFSAYASSLLLAGGLDSGTAGRFYVNAIAITEISAAFDNFDTIYIETNGSYILGAQLHAKESVTIIARENVTVEFDISTQRVHIEAKILTSSAGNIRALNRLPGPAPGILTQTFPGGGAHGGTGGAFAQTAYAQPYGSFATPTLPGSCGANASSGSEGGRGGGVIYIKAESMEIEGTINAAGNGGFMGSAGGSGGSILIYANSISGPGNILAYGGDGFTPGGSAGGGGRIALYYNTGGRAAHTGQLAARGGDPSGVFPETQGGAGTIFESEFRGSGLQNFTKLYVNNFASGKKRALTPGAESGFTWLTEANMPSLHFSALEVNGGARLAFAIPGVNITVDDITGDSTSVIHIDAGQSLYTPVSEFLAGLWMHPSSFASFPPVFTLSGDQSVINGTICNVEVLQIEHGVTFGTQGSTCNSQVGSYRFNVVRLNNALSLLNANAGITNFVGDVCITNGVALGGITLNITNITGPLPLQCDPAPGIPYQFGAVPMLNSAALSWLPPLSHAEYARYFVQQQSGSNWTNVCSSGLLNCTVSGLLPDTTYTFRIAALNSLNSSDFSYINISTLTAIPSAPLAFNYTSYTRSQIILTWTAPNYTAGLPIVNFIISYSSNGSPWTNVTLSNTTFTYNLTQLNTSTLYTFQLYVITLGGSSVSNITSVVTAPNLCGDGICDSGETCSTCFLDCTDDCGVLNCPKDCSSHGTCVAGLCNCNARYSGPDCSISASLPTVVDTGDKLPEATIKVDTSATTQKIRENAFFTVGIHFIQEINEKNIPQFTYQISSLPFVKSNAPTANGVTVYEYGATLPNQAELIVNISTFNQDATVYFANQPVNIASGSVKIAVKVLRWPFASILNKLQIGFNTTAISEKVKVSDKVKIDTSTIGNGLRSVSVGLRSLTLYTRFLETAIIDGIVRKVQFLVSTENQLVTVATVPHFWQSAEFDPDYQVLINSPDKGNNKNITWIIVGVVVGVLVLAVIIGLTMYYYQRKHEKSVDKVLLAAGMFDANGEPIPVPTGENKRESKRMSAKVESPPHEKSKRMSKVPSFESPDQSPLPGGTKGKIGVESLEAGYSQQLRENPSKADANL